MIENRDWKRIDIILCHERPESCKLPCSAKDKEDRKEYETPRIFGNPPPPRRTVRAYLHFDDSTSGKKFLNECIVKMVYFEKCSWGAG